MSTDALPRGVYVRGIAEDRRPEKASQTLLNKISDCPYSGALYLDFRGGPQSHEMARGEALHQCFELGALMAIENAEEGERAATIPPDVAKDTMQAILDERTDLALSPKEHEACRIAAWNWARFSVFDPEAFIGVEIMLELQLGNWLVRGKIDYLEIRDGIAYVRDYKTGLYLPSQEEHDDDHQQQFYGLLATEGVPEGETVPLGRGLTGAQETAVYPRILDRDENSMYTRTVFKDRGQIFDFKRTVESNLAKLDHGLLTGEWKASPGSHCNFCPAQHECPIPNQELPATVATEGQALEVAGQVLTLEPQLKELKQSLKVFVDEHGPIEIGGQVFDFRPNRTEKTRDKDALKAALRSAGIDPDDFFRVEIGTTFGHKKVSTKQRSSE